MCSQDEVKTLFDECTLSIRPSSMEVDSNILQFKSLEQVRTPEKG